MTKESTRYIVRIAIGILVAAGGVAHFTYPTFFQALVPVSLGAHRLSVNAVTGILQILIGVSFLFQRLHNLARWTTITLLVATLPQRSYK